MFPISDSIRTSTFSYVNIFIILVTVFVFIQELITPNTDSFIRTYALVPSQIHSSDISSWFPFITAIFLHGGFLHILTNIWFLWVFGDDVEGYFGHLPYFFLYVFFGIIGNIVQYLTMASSSVPILGASGAIAGVLGAYFVLFPHSRVKTVIFIFFFITLLDIPAWIMLGYWFVLQLISGATSFTDAVGGVAFWAHVGGFVTGAIIAKLTPQRIPSLRRID